MRREHCHVFKRNELGPDWYLSTASNDFWLSGVTSYDITDWGYNHWSHLDGSEGDWSRELNPEAREFVPREICEHRWNVFAPEFIPRVGKCSKSVGSMSCEFGEGIDQGVGKGSYGSSPLGWNSVAGVEKCAVMSMASYQNDKFCDRYQCVGRVDPYGTWNPIREQPQTVDSGYSSDSLVKSNDVLNTDKHLQRDSDCRELIKRLKCGNCFDLELNSNSHDVTKVDIVQSFVVFLLKTSYCNMI